MSINVYGNNFSYFGKNSSDYGVIICGFEVPDTVRDTAINYTINKSELSPNRTITNYYNRKYDDVLKFTVGICREQNKPFTEAERRDIVGWLTSSNGYQLFHVQDFTDSDYHQNIDYFATCIGYKEFIPNSDINGMSFDFECNAPYGFTPEEVTNFDITDTGAVTINNTSDEWSEDYYPVMEIEGKATETITITNATYPETTMELKIKNGQRLLIDNQNGDITDNVGIFDYSTDTNLKWLHLKHGENVITITGNVKGCIRCRYIRKVGI